MKIKPRLLNCLWGTIGALNMHRSSSMSKLGIQKSLLLHQLTKHRYILMLCPRHHCSMSYHCKLFIGMYNRSHLWSAVITCSSEISGTMYLFEWKVTFQDTLHTNGSGMPSCYCCVTRREFSQLPQRHMLYFGTFVMGDLPRAFLIIHGAFKPEITEPW